MLSSFLKITTMYKISLVMYSAKRRISFATQILRFAQDDDASLSLTSTRDVANARQRYFQLANDGPFLQGLLQVNPHPDARDTRLSASSCDNMSLIRPSQKKRSTFAALAALFGHKTALEGDS